MDLERGTSLWASVSFASHASFSTPAAAGRVCNSESWEAPPAPLAAAIDNGLARLIPFLEASEAKVVEGLLNSTILEGRLLLAVQLSRVDDLYEDDCVDVEFFQAYGEPLLGTDGGVLPGQTLLRNPDTPTGFIEGMSIDCGVLDARHS